MYFKWINKVYFIASIHFFVLISIPSEGRLENISMIRFSFVFFYWYLAPVVNHGGLIYITFLPHTRNMIFLFSCQLFWLIMGSNRSQVTRSCFYDFFVWLALWGWFEKRYLDLPILRFPSEDLLKCKKHCQKVINKEWAKLRKNILLSNLPYF